VATIAFKGKTRGTGVVRGDVAKLVSGQSGQVIMAGHLFRPANADDYFLRELRRNGGDGLAAAESTVQAIERGLFADKPIAPELVDALVEYRHRVSGSSSHQLSTDTIRQL
jgi:hypothetical protein